MVLVAEDIPPMTRDGGFRFTDRGPVELRGIPGAIHVLSAHPDNT